jgi:hypothetical protein
MRVKLARFLRLPTVALAKEGAPRKMSARRAVLLTPSESTRPTQLLSCQRIASIISLESTLVEVFILNNLNLFRINTYEKHRGWGLLLLTRHPTKAACPERRLVPSEVEGSGVKDLSSSATKHVYPGRRLLPSEVEGSGVEAPLHSRHSPLATGHFAPLQSLRFRQGVE